VVEEIKGGAGNGSAGAEVAAAEGGRLVSVAASGTIDGGAAGAHVGRIGCIADKAE
jgi:hypothetical protein